MTNPPPNSVRARFVLWGALALFVASAALFLIDPFARNPLELDPEGLALNARFVREQTPAWDEHSASLVQTAADAFRAPLEIEQDHPEGDSNKDGDSVWQQYPRTVFAFTEQVWSIPFSFSADELFRNQELNPHDIVMSLHAQTRLTALVEEGATRLRDLRYMAHSYSMLELSTLIDGQRARHVNYREYVDRLSEKEQEAIRAQKAEALARHRQNGMTLEEATDLVSRTRIMLSGHPILPFKVYAQRNDEDDFYGAELEELPLTQQAVAAWKACVVEFAFHALYVFMSEGCHDQEGMDRLLAIVQRNM